MTAIHIQTIQHAGQRLCLGIQCITAHHSDSQHITVHHGSSRLITARHGTSRRITTHHSDSQHITACHSASQRIKAHHGTSQCITAHQGASRCITTHHSDSQHITAHHSAGNAKRRCPSVPAAFSWRSGRDELHILGPVEISNSGSQSSSAPPGTPDFIGLTNSSRCPGDGSSWD